jgi:hypothetical protein
MLLPSFFSCIFFLLYSTASMPGSPNANGVPGLDVGKNLNVSALFMNRPGT